MEMITLPVTIFDSRNHTSTLSNGRFFSAVSAQVVIVFCRFGEAPESGESYIETYLYLFS